MRLLLIFTALLGLAACSSQVLQQPAPDKTVTTDAEAAPLVQGRHYQVDKALSELRIISYPDARLGHAHVIGGQAITGNIVVPDDPHQVWLRLGVKLSELVVDKPGWRQDESLEPDMSERAINGTRDNMLSAKVLDAKNHPEIQIEANAAVGPLWQSDVKARITLAGTTREVLVPVAVFKREGALDIVGRIEILQSDFGIVPFSALGGILRIADKLLIRFRIHASSQ